MQRLTQGFDNVLWEVAGGRNNQRVSFRVHYQSQIKIPRVRHFLSMYARWFYVDNRNKAKQKIKRIV